MGDLPPLQRVSQIGAHLARLTRPNKDALVKPLQEAANDLAKIEQRDLKDPEAWKELEAAIQPLRKSILKHGLLRHTDKDVRILVAICVTESFRILSPVQPFEDKYLRDVFKLILSMFTELADATSPYFSKRVKILETIAHLHCCVLMVDFCDDLVIEMFNIFFSVVREHHERILINDILLIMTNILREEVSPALLDVILRNLIKEGKSAPSAASQLAGSVIQACSSALQPFICGFLSSCSIDIDAVESPLKEFYHEILFKIFQYAPHMLHGIIPNLIQELLTDQVDVRIKAINFIGKLFTLPECHVAQEYHSLFTEYKNRFTDKSVEVRLSALQCAKACYMGNPFGKESRDVLTAVEGRLLDFDDRVRTKALVIACDLARYKLEYFPPEVISKATERLRDKKISVRKKALQKLMEIYRDYCSKCSEGSMTTSDDFEHIPCKALMLIYDKDWKEFRSQGMDVILAHDLFPENLSIKERTRHWIHLSSLFTPLHLKALSSILSQKRRLQSEMKIYLARRKKEKDGSSEEMQERIKHSFIKMSMCFPDPSEAEKFFHELNRLKDNKVFNALELLLDDHKITSSQTTRDKILKTIGKSHPNFEFLQLLSSKCSLNIFSSDHIHCILESLSRNAGVEHLEPASAQLLLAIIRTFPSLLRGSEELFKVLVPNDLLNDTVVDTVIEILAIAAPNIPDKFSDFYPFLKRICLEGTRVQSKHAVSAIASFVGSSEQPVFSKLCKELVDSLYAGRHTPTVLQSLGCIAQHSVSAYESQDREIRSFLFANFFQVGHSDNPTSSEEIAQCSDSCKLKALYAKYQLAPISKRILTKLGAMLKNNILIYALKTFVKGFLPHSGSCVTREVDELMEIISRILQKHDAFDETVSCSIDCANIRLAAAKSVLQLSKRWDLHISPEVFRFTILVAKDSSSFVRRSFLDKVHKLLRACAIPGRYACAFALGTSDCSKDLQDPSFKYMEEFIKAYSREGRIHQTSAVQGASVTDYPANMLAYLIHILAHDSHFPSSDCQDEQVYAAFCSPIFYTLKALLNVYDANSEPNLANDAASYLLSTFHAIKKAEDNVDAQGTPKLKILSDIGICIVNTLSHNLISSSRAPGVILLPSSLYRVSLIKCDEANLKCPTQYPADKSFAKGVVNILKSRTSMPASTLPKCGTSEMQKHASQEISRCSRKRAFPLIASESAALNNEHSATEACENYAYKCSKPNSDKEILASSHDSATMKSSLSEFQVSILNTERSVLSLSGSIGARRGISAKSSQHSGAKHKDMCSLKQCSLESKVIIGKKIKVLSPVDNCFYSGTVVGFNSDSKMHEISYDSGEVELFCLDSKGWETISEISQAEKENISSKDSNVFHSSLCDPIGHSSHSKELNAFRDGTTKQPKRLANKSGVPAKGRKEQTSLSYASMSEVVDANDKPVLRRSQRTRREV